MQYEEQASPWVEYSTQDGRKYWYNKVTGKSSWEKPQELMNDLEKADATTNWKEFKHKDGRTYYYNKETKVSVWEIPRELKKAREKAIQEKLGVRPVETGGPKREQTDSSVKTNSSVQTKVVKEDDKPEKDPIEKVEVNSGTNLDVIVAQKYVNMSWFRS